MAQDPTGMKGAAQVANSPQSRRTKDAADVLARMRDRLEQSLSAYSDSRDSELDDLRFMAGSPDNRWQWPQEVLATRGAVQGQTINARPCLTINKLPQHVRQVTNDQRQNRPSGKVIPVDDQADIEVAEVLNGVVRHIEYMSDADVVYDTACDNQVTYGEGYFRILTEYCDETSFDQDLRLQRIRNSFSVYMDPHIQDPCGSDAEYCFITEDMPKDEFARLFPDAEPISSISTRGVGDEQLSQWILEDSVRIAEYFYAVYDKATLHLYPNNRTAYANSPEARQMEMMGVRPLRIREVEIRKIKWMKTNGYEILEEQDWPGKWIPVVRVIGNEFEVDGRIYISGLVRNAKDAQRMYNYWVSQEAEMLALAPKAPFIGYGGQFEGYEHQWKTANTTNWPYLEVNPDVTDGQGAVLPLPQRAQPPLAQTGLIQAKMGASDDIKSTTGYYDSSLGETSNERSGRAILARERQGDTGSYHYVDNLARAIRYGTRQLIDLIPKIYDTQRIARIIGIDGETSTARIDPTQEEAVRQVVNEAGIVIEKIYNPSVGKYDVAVTTGPSYLTKRQEAMDAMSQILQANPELWNVAGDLFVKNMDWPGAQEIAKRLQKTIEPRILEDEEDPALQAVKMENDALKQQMQEMRVMLDSVQKSIDEREVRVKEYDAETKRISTVQAGMTPEQIQDIVMGTISGMMTSGDLVAPVPRETAMPMELPPQ
jgi:Phage P22-like portal protein